MSGSGWGRGDHEPFLAKLPPGPHRLPRELVRDNQRRRILLAALDVFGEVGFATATVKDLIQTAHVSRATFYEIFADKEACMVALLDELLAWLNEQVAAAVAEAAGWEGQVRAGVGRTVELLSSDRRLTLVCAVEAPMATAPAIRTRFDGVVEELCVGLRAGRAESPRGAELPGILEPAMVYGAIYLVGRSIAEGEVADAAALAAELGDLLLIPYLG